jgi:ankyrin repeat protein
MKMKKIFTLILLVNVIIEVCGIENYLPDKIYSAACNNQIEEIQEYLKANGDVNAKQSFPGSSTMLSCACSFGYFDLAKFLLENGASVEISESDESWRSSPLLDACQPYYPENQNPELVQLLIDYKANLEDTDSYGNTPLLVAADKGNFEIVAVLLKNKANFDHKNEGRLNACMIAKQNLESWNNKYNMTKDPTVLFWVQRYKKTCKVLTEFEEDEIIKDS